MAINTEHLLKIYTDLFIKMIPQAQGQSNQNMLFLMKDPFDIKLDQKIDKILGCFPTYDNTFCIIGIKSHRNEFVGHYSPDGKIIKEKTFYDSNLFPFAAISDRIIAWIDNDRDLLLQWNLETDELLEFVFKYNNDTADSHELFIFPETKLLCVGEWGRHDSNFLRFTFFEYPLVSKEQEPVYVYEDDQVWTNEYTIRRANVRGSFVWWTTSQKETMQFRALDVKKDANGKWIHEYKEYKTANKFEADGGGPCEFSIGYMSELVPGKYLIISITDRPTDMEKNIWPKSHFVYEVQGDLLREVNYDLNDQGGHFKFKNVHWTTFGNTTMIRGFDHAKGESLVTPVYYIDNATENIVARDEWKCSHLNKFFFHGEDSNMIIDCQYENADVDHVKGELVKVVSPKEIYVHFLEAWGQGCKIDQNLLNNVCQLLTTV